MALDPTDLRRLKDAFNTWAQNTPDPDAPVIDTTVGKSYSAKELAHQVENEIGFGKTLIKMVELSVKDCEATLDQIIASYTAPKPPKP
jgi:hypothetical protein